MKKIIKISILLITIMMSMMVTSNAFTAKTSIDKEYIEVGDEVVYKISCDKKVIGANFSIEYDPKCFELIDSRTSGLNVATKDEEIMCIYANIEGKGINDFEVAFKATKPSKETTFSIGNVKFRAVGQKESYTFKSTSGLEDIDVKIDKTLAMSIVYIVIIGIGVIIMGVTILVVSNKLKKSGILKKFLSSILALFIISSLAPKVEAVENDIVINFSKLEGEKIVQIVLSKDDEDKQVTKQEIIAKNNTIISIKDENGQEIKNDEIIKTGYTLETRNGISKIVLLGDANGDGYVCDTDDIMVIIDDYLGNEPANNIQKLAANLYNADDILDIDDVMQMIDMYLGRLEDNLLTQPLQTNTEETEDTEIPKSELKVGDVIKYNSDIDITSMNLKWRIWKIEGETIQIIPIPAIVQNCDYTFAKYAIAVETKLNGPYTGSNWDNCSSYTEFATFQKCFNQEYAKEMSFPLQEDYNNYKNSTDSNISQIFNNYFVGSYWVEDTYGSAASTTGDTERVGLRPIVTLKENIKIGSGSGTEIDPFILVK